MLYPLYCTLYLCTFTLTRQQLQALVALSFAFISDVFRSNPTVCTSLATTQQALSLTILFRNLQTCVFRFFCWKMAVATTAILSCITNNLCSRTRKYFLHNPRWGPFQIKIKIPMPLHWSTSYGLNANFDPPYFSLDNTVPLSMVMIKIKFRFSGNMFNNILWRNGTRSLAYL
jgi:hypothetical protein